MKLTANINPTESIAFANGFGIYVKQKEYVDYTSSRLKEQPFIGGVWKREERARLRYAYMYTRKILKNE